MGDLGARIDHLLERLEPMVELLQEYEYVARSGVPPRRATYRPAPEVQVRPSERKRRPIDLVRIRGRDAILRGRESVPRGAKLELTVIARKTRHGEILHVASIRITETRKVANGYEMEARLYDIRRKELPAERRLMECVMARDAAGWNRWCADLEEGAVLRGIDLRRAVLTNFDLCCADLSGSDLREANLAYCMLSGANLEGCNLDGAVTTGADLFGARVPSCYENLVGASGMIEVESVTFVD